MNKRSFYNLEFTGIFVSAILGLILQFAYNLSGGSPWCLIFASVSDSIWEMQKVFAIPYLAWSVITLAVSKPSFKPFFVSKIAGAYIIVFGSILMCSLINGLFGKRFRIVEIIISIAFTALGHIFSSNASFHKGISSWFVTALFALALFVASYFCFTYSPPQAQLFSAF